VPRSKRTIATDRPTDLQLTTSHLPPRPKLVADRPTDRPTSCRTPPCDRATPTHRRRPRCGSPPCGCQQTFITNHRRPPSCSAPPGRAHPHRQRCTRSSGAVAAGHLTPQPRPAQHMLLAASSRLRCSADAHDLCSTTMLLRPAVRRASVVTQSRLNHPHRSLIEITSAARCMPRPTC
jgi:hypothetical protein